MADLRDRMARATEFSVSADNMLFPSFVPGNELLAGDIRGGSRRPLKEEEFQRALDFALKTGIFRSLQPGQEGPISPLGSGFEFPERITDPNRLFFSTGKILGMSPLKSAIAFPGSQRFTLR